MVLEAVRTARWRSDATSRHSDTDCGSVFPDGDEFSMSSARHPFSAPGSVGTAYGVPESLAAGRLMWTGRLSPAAPRDDIGRRGDRRLPARSADQRVAGVPQRFVARASDYSTDGGDGLRSAGRRSERDDASSVFGPHWSVDCESRWWDWSSGYCQACFIAGYDGFTAST